VRGNHPVTIKDPTLALLMEAMRLLDEAQAGGR
jgi:hypothetical protein